MNTVHDTLVGLLILAPITYGLFLVARFIWDEAWGDSIEADRLRRERRAARKERRR